MAFLTWDEAVALAESIQERYRALVYVAIDTGMRWSELVGLRRSKVDLHRRKVRVTEQLIRLDGGEWLRKETKTAAGIRSITISAFTATVLSEHLECVAEPGPDAVVFTNTAGKPLISSSFWQHHFRAALLAAGLDCRFHDLRHTSVALAIAQGAHPKAIQTRMGHSSINVTFDRYGHLFPELDEAIASGFDGQLRNARLRLVKSAAS
jgi:integrase